MPAFFLEFEDYCNDVWKFVILAKDALDAEVKCRDANKNVHSTMEVTLTRIVEISSIPVEV